MQTLCMCMCVPLLFVLVKVHWIYLLFLRGQFVWDPSMVEIWEIRSKVKARNTIQCVLCINICVYWGDEAVSSERVPCTDHQACDGRCSRGI